MANKNIIGMEFIVTDRGTLKAVGKQSEKTAASMNRVAAAGSRVHDSQDKYMRRNKGVAGSTSNTTKSFSKMQQGIEGGLVPAYATLAANIFALTAAFGALSRASAVERLAAGLEFTGNAAGVNLKKVSDGLREITGEAVSAREAMTTTALGVSAGFDSSQLEGLTKVAKGASLALGRDMEDALSRLARGAAKLEPEILDELGIMVRLDDATETYAAQLGKTASELSQFERRQAFVNAIITQGEKKFGDLAQAIEASPYDQLSATFKSLTDSGLGLVNKVLSPLIDLLASKPTALLGVLTIFGANVARSMIPSLQNMSKAIEESAKRTQAVQEVQLKQLATNKRLTPAVQKYVDAIGTAEMSEKKLASAIRGSAQSYRMQRGALKDVLFSSQMLTKDTLTRTKLYINSARIVNTITQAELQHALAKQQLIAAQGVQLIQQGNLMAGLKLTTLAIREQTAATLTATKSAAAWGKATIFVSGAIKVLGTAAKVTGTLLSRMLPVVGQLLFAYTLVEMVISKLSPEMSAYNKALEASEEQAEQFAKTQKQLGNSLRDANKSGVEVFRLGITAMAGEMRESAVVLTAILDEIINDIDDRRERYKNNLEREGGFWGFLLKGAALAGRGVLPPSAEELQASAAASADVANPNKVQDFTGELSQKIKSLKTELSLLTATGKLSEGSISALQAKIDSLVMVYDKFNNATEVAKTELVQAKSDIDKVSYSFNQLSGSLSAAQQITQDTQAWFVKLEKDAGPLADGIKLVARSIQAIAEGDAAPEGVLAELEEVFDKFKTGPKDIEALHKAMMDMNNDLLNANTRLKNAEETAQAKREEGGYVNRIQAEVDLMAQRTAVAEVYTRVIQSGLVPEALSVKLQERRAEIEKKNADSSRKATMLQRSYEKEIAQNTLRQIEIEKQLLDTRKQLTDEAFKQLEIQQDILKQQALKAGLGELRPQDTAKLEMLAATNKVRAAKAAYDFTEQSISLEWAILDAKLALLEAQFNADNHISAEERAVLTLTATLFEKQKGLIGQRLKTAEAEVNAAREQKEATAAAIAGEGFSGGSDVIDQITAYQVALNELGQKGLANAFKDSNATAQVTAIQGLMEPLIATAEQLGPEGELIAAVTEGALLMADTFVTAMETMGDSVQSKLLGSLQIAAGAVQSLSSIMAASSKANIANVDREIESEKRRDGKSRESLAKIEALERKKEKLKKKQFEQDKKMKMAQVVINTAAGIMQAIGTMGPFGIAMAAVIAALGAAQLAVISGSTYEGGGAGTSAGPSKIAIGDRSNSIDLATSRSPAGEQAYMRGEMGVGNTGANNYIPQGAFTGRATGGNTALLVGEQGPEMFIPDRPGTILPADETESVGGVYNVNFSINTIDSQGMEEALRAQRGPIIGMIREAANAHGEFFLEDINTMEE